MVKLLFVLFSIHYLLITNLSAANVKASVNTQEVVQGNTVQFSIEASGGSAAFPNIREINGIDVSDLGTSTSTSMSIGINGVKRESKTIRRYQFIPNKNMVIPSYNVRIGSKNLKTKAIQIKVVKSTASTMHSGNTYSFEMKSNKKSMVVGESFIVTLYLSLAESLGVQQVSEYVEPSSAGFFFKDLGKQKQYKRGNLNVLEKQYSVTAKQEGNFTISNASAKVGITDRSRQDLFGRYGIRWINVASNTLLLEVKSRKIDTDLVGEFTIDSKIDMQKVKANKPVNLTIHIGGKGNLEDFVFPKYDIDGVTIYDNEAKIDSHMQVGKLVSNYSKNFVFIADESFTIPKRTISAYNTKSHEMEILEIPSYEVTIEKKKGLSSILPTIKTPSTKIEKPKVEEKAVKVVHKNVIQWWLLLVAFMLGMFVMYLLRFIPNSWNRKEKHYKETEALKLLYSHISDDKAVEDMVHKLYAKKNGDKTIKIDKKILKEMVERFR